MTLWSLGEGVKDIKGLVLKMCDECQKLCDVILDDRYSVTNEDFKRILIILFLPKSQNHKGLTPFKDVSLFNILP